MKINGNNRIMGINPYQKANQPGLDKAKKTGMGRDELQISTEALEMLNSQKTEELDRKERIAELKKQIEAGTYKVDSKLIAEKMFDQLKGT